MPSTPDVLHGALADMHQLVNTAILSHRDWVSSERRRLGLSKDNKNNLTLGELRPRSEWKWCGQAREEMRALLKRHMERMRDRQDASKM